jgi:hypothetical protein
MTAWKRDWKLSGYLLIAAGCTFFGASYFGKQVAFAGVGCAMVAIEASYLAIAQRHSRIDWYFDLE